MFQEDNYLKSLFLDKFPAFVGEVIKIGESGLTWGMKAQLIEGHVRSMMDLDKLNLGIIGMRYVLEATSRSMRFLQLRDAGIADNPKADNVWNLAYEYGHSNGYDEIWGYIQDLAELVKE